MNRVRLLLAGALIACLSMAPIGSVHADTRMSGPLSITIDTAYLLRDCKDYNFPYAVSLEASNHWNLDISVQDPSGRETATGFEYGTGSLTGNADVFMCDYEGPSTFTVISTLTVDSLDYSTESTYTTTTSWALIRSNSVTSARLSDTAVNQGTIVTMKGRVLGGSGPYQGRPAGSDSVKLQVRFKGTTTWKTFVTVTTDAYGRYAKRLKTSTGRSFYVRARFIGDEVLRPSTSKPVLLAVR